MIIDCHRAGPSPHLLDYLSGSGRRLVGDPVECKHCGAKEPLSFADSRDQLCQPGLSQRPVMSGIKLHADALDLSCAPGNFLSVSANSGPTSASSSQIAFSSTASSSFLNELREKRMKDSSGLTVYLGPFTSTIAFTTATLNS